MDPLVFAPFFRPQVWGGRRLEQFLGQPLPGDEPYGEAWLVSAQPLHVSRVCEGPHAGRLLSELWTNESASMIGPVRGAPSDFPLLLKFLDCQDFLSVQVHPSDEVSRQMHLGEQGKSEVWIVLDVEPDARIYAGLRPGTTRAKLEACLRRPAPCRTANTRSFRTRATASSCRRALSMRPAAGILIAEVQQSSDVTFRLFDWHRLGPDGKPAPCMCKRRCIASIGHRDPLAPSCRGRFPSRRMATRASTSWPASISQSTAFN